MTRPLLLLFSVFAVLAMGAAAPLSASAASADVLTICDEMPYADFMAPAWTQNVAQSSQITQITGRGIGAFDCAPQYKLFSMWTCTDDGNGNSSCRWVPTTFLRGATGFALPDKVVTPTDGASFAFSLQVTGMDRILWPVCFPANKNGPGDCPESRFDDVNGRLPYHGALAYRVRGTDGLFGGRWNATMSGGTPGFWIESLSMANCQSLGSTGGGGMCACPETTLTCHFQIHFKKDAQGKPVITRDIQVVLEMESRVDSIPNVQQGYSVQLAIPLVIKAPDFGSSGTPPTNPTTGGSQNPAPQANAGVQPTTTQQNTAATPKPKCIVPKLAKVTLASAKTRLVAARCKLGTTKSAYHAKVKKGRVISFSRKPGWSGAVGTKVDVVISKGPKPKKRRSMRSAAVR